jgi:hypothetical protein
VESRDTKVGEMLVAVGKNTERSRVVSLNKRKSVKQCSCS